MAKGYGIQTSDWLLFGVIAVGGYLYWKSIGKGVSTATEGLGSGIAEFGAATGNVSTRYGEALGSYADVFNTAFDKVSQGISNIGSSKSTPLSASSLNISTYDNDVARANTAATFSNASYNSTTGVLIDKSGKGYSVAPSEVPKVLKGIQTGIQPPKPGSKLPPSLTVTKKPYQ